MKVHMLLKMLFLLIILRLKLLVFSPFLLAQYGKRTWYKSTIMATFRGYKFSVFSVTVCSSSLFIIDSQFSDSVTSHPL